MEEENATLRLPSLRLGRPVVNGLRLVLIVGGLWVASEYPGSEHRMWIRGAVALGVVVGLAALSGLGRLETATLDEDALVLNRLTGRRRIRYTQIMSVSHQRQQTGLEDEWVMELELRGGDHERVSTYRGAKGGPGVKAAKTFIKRLRRRLRGSSG